MGEILAQVKLSGGARIALHRGDLTLESVDALVNAANSRLAHGGGVAGALIRRGGLEIQIESDAFVERYGPVPVGNAAWTGPGKLGAQGVKGIIHTVGPMWGEGDEPAKLLRAAMSAFRLAVQRECASIALPAISSGIFGFPKDRCAEILIGAALEFLESHPVETLQEIRFTIIDDETVSIFRDEFMKRFGKETLLIR